MVLRKSKARKNVTNGITAARQTWELVERSLVFSGQPPAMSGDIELRNYSGERIKIKRLPLADLDLRAPDDGPLEAIEVFARLEPHQTLIAPARFRVDPQTPPGTYRGHLLIDKGRRPLTVQVFEKRRLRVTPAQLSVHVRHGRAEQQTVSVTNIGNVPFALRNVSFEPLREHDGLRRSVFASLKHRSQGHEKVLDEFVREIGAKLIDPECIEIKCKKDIIEQGTTMPVTLQFHLPKKFESGRRYSGSLFFENAELEIVIETDTRATPQRSAANE